MIPTYCRCSSSVEHQLPKLRRRVRFPSSALIIWMLKPVKSRLPLFFTFRNTINIQMIRKTVREKGIIVRLLKQIGFILILGGIYLGVVLATGYGIPCLFYKITGWKCPGCGMTRAVVEIWKGNFKEALQYNFLSLTIWPFICLYLLYRLVREELHKGEEFHTWEYAVLIGLLIVIIGYAYMRNTI